MKGFNFDIDNLVKFTQGELSGEESALIRQEAAQDEVLQQIIEGIRIDELNGGEESLVDFINRTGEEFSQELFVDNTVVADEAPSDVASGSKLGVYAVAAAVALGLLTFGTKLTYDNYTGNNVALVETVVADDAEKEIISAELNAQAVIDGAGFTFEVIEKSETIKVENKAGKEDFVIMPLDEAKKAELANTTVEDVNYRLSIKAGSAKANGQTSYNADIFIEDANKTDFSSGVSSEMVEQQADIESKTYSVTVNDAAGQDKELDITINSALKNHGNACPASIYMINALPEGIYQAEFLINSKSIIKDGQKVTYISSENIIMDAPFEVELGASYDAVILKQDTASGKN